MVNVAKNLEAIKNQIHEYEVLFKREPNSVSLLAVSKGQSLEKIQQAVLAGQQAFGENYLQEALEKMAALADKNIEWHFIGSIQSNKTQKIAENFNWVHSVSEPKICKRLNDQRPLHLSPLNICLEVNVSEEASKTGADFADIFSLAELCASLPRLKLRGLMTIPTPKTDFNEQKAELHKLRILFDELNKKKFMLDALSMGMSNDMKAAIAEGATIVRIGTAIFGPRNYRS